MSMGTDGAVAAGWAVNLGSGVWIGEAGLERGLTAVGRADCGRDALVAGLVADRLRRQAAGGDDGAMVAITPRGDLFRRWVASAPPELGDRLAVLDFSRAGLPPGANLLDPRFFPDRDRCVGVIVQTLSLLWEHWGDWMETALRNGLLALYEFNAHPDTTPDEMLTMLDLPRLLEAGDEVAQGRRVSVQMNAFQRRALERVSDPVLRRWFNGYLDWNREVRAEVVAPIEARVGAYEVGLRARAALGGPGGLEPLERLVADGVSVLAYTAPGFIGLQVASLVGSGLAELAASALATGEGRLLLVCDQFPAAAPGLDWDHALGDFPHRGGSLLLAADTLAERGDALDRFPRWADVAGGVGSLVAYRMPVDHGGAVAAALGESVDLSGLPPGHCVVRGGDGMALAPLPADWMGEAIAA